MEETKKLEILVVEDNPIHMRAAIDLLKEHSLTRSWTFDEAATLIAGKFAGSPLNAEGKKYFDVVLTDLMYTQGSGKMQADKALADEQMPFGFPLALIAATQEIPLIGIITDMNHHQHPMAYMFDFFKDIDKGRFHNPIKVNKSKLIFFDNGCIEPTLYALRNGGYTSEYPIATKNYQLDPIGKPIVVKNWKAALDALLS